MRRDWTDAPPRPRRLRAKIKASGEKGQGSFAGETIATVRKYEKGLIAKTRGATATKVSLRTTYNNVNMCCIFPPTLHD